MIRIGRFENGICLNQLEYLLEDKDGDVKLFASKNEAKDFLRSAGITNEDSLEDCFVYENEDTGEQV